MDSGKLEHSLMGTPHLSLRDKPLLFNIYMFPFDKYVFTEFIEPHLTNAHKPLQNRVSIGGQIRKILAKRKAETNTQIKSDLLTEFKKLRTKRFNIPSLESDTGSKPVYVRYADDWVLLLPNQKVCRAETKEIKEKISMYLLEELKLTLSEDKTHITKLTDGISFLGFILKQNTTKNIKLAYVTQVMPGGKKMRSLRRLGTRNMSIRPDYTRINNKFNPKGPAVQMTSSLSLKHHGFISQNLKS